MEDNERFQQLTSDTRICELVLRLKEDTFSKVCEDVNNWLNLCETLTW